MPRHRHVTSVRADGLRSVLGPLLTDRRVRAAGLVDVDSGMVLDAWAADRATTDAEVLGAAHAELVRIGRDLLVGAGGDRDGVELVLRLGGHHHVLRPVPDPHGGRLVLAVVVDGPPRVVERVRRRLRDVSEAALTAGPSMSRRPGVGGWPMARTPPAAPVLAPAPTAPAALAAPARPSPPSPVPVPSAGSPSGWWTAPPGSGPPARPAPAPPGPPPSSSPRPDAAQQPAFLSLGGAPSGPGAGPRPSPSAALDPSPTAVRAVPSPSAAAPPPIAAAPPAPIAAAPSAPIASAAPPQAVPEPAPPQHRRPSPSAPRAARPPVPLPALAPGPRRRSAG